MDKGIHKIDLVRHVMGPVREVYGKALRQIWGLDRVEDNGFALLTGVNGVVGSLHASWTEWRGYRFFLEAYGSRGMARASYAPMRTTLITMDRPGGRPKRREHFYPSLILREKLRGWQSTAIATLASEITDFRAVVEGREPAGPIASAEDGFRAIEIANAVYETSATGQAAMLAESV
jgi:predicted dehydrogenase